MQESIHKTADIDNRVQVASVLAALAGGAGGLTACNSADCYYIKCAAVPGTSRDIVGNEVSSLGGVACPQLE